MKIIGVGCGPGMISLAAIEAIGQADLIYGSKRAIELAKDHISKNCTVHEITDYKRLRELREDAVLLSTGDPMLAGLGYLGGQIIPGISSMQVAFARLGISLTRGVIINVHGRDHSPSGERIIEEVRRGNIVFVIADPEYNISETGALITNAGIECNIAICERLGYPDERIAVSRAKSPPEPVSPLFSLVIGDFPHPNR